MWMYEFNITQQKYKICSCKTDYSHPVRVTGLKLKDQKYNSLL
jgi:hypothetical protein